MKFYVGFLDSASLLVQVILGVSCLHTDLPKPANTHTRKSFCYCLCIVYRDMGQSCLAVTSETICGWLLFFGGVDTGVEKQYG